MNADSLARYVACMEALRDSVPPELCELLSPEVHFRDPFNETFGIAHYVRVLEDMLEKIATLEIRVTHAVLADPRRAGESGIGLLRWDLSGELRSLGGRPWRVRGCSELLFAPDGRIRAHFDHWDAAGQFYETLPMLGPCLRRLRQRLRVA